MLIIEKSEATDKPKEGIITQVAPCSSDKIAAYKHPVIPDFSANV